MEKEKEPKIEQSKTEQEKEILECGYNIYNKLDDRHGEQILMEGGKIVLRKWEDFESNSTELKPGEVEKMLAIEKNYLIQKVEKAKEKLEEEESYLRRLQQFIDLAERRLSKPDKK
jgi:hypothetical protein